MTLERFGWTALRQQEFAVYAADGLLPGRVVGEHRSHFRVATAAGELTAEAPQRMRKSAGERSDLPGVGDFVALRPALGDGPAAIEAVLPRTTALIRKASGEKRPQLLAANIDYVFIVTAPDGDFNLPRLERYLALVRESGADPVVVLNKSDLAQDLPRMIAEISALAPGIAVHTISARDLASLGEIERYFDGNRTIVLIGSSGVGKSTMTNQLLGRVVQATQEVRAHDSRGRHTTTDRQLFQRPSGGSLIDMPGLRGLELWNAAAEAVDAFEDIATLASQCRFANCRHVSEPGCAVRAALDKGEIDADRFARYMKDAPSPEKKGRSGRR
ncbi:MAG: ribosome small subunit-dependent GTPase A [Hyphomicrobium sp.]|nr:ribosome small subunit-dependent GTPase A [Hyphomicrobium sp.]